MAKQKDINDILRDNGEEAARAFCRRRSVRSVNKKSAAAKFHELNNRAA
jgi:hypothetical protein